MISHSLEGGRVFYESNDLRSHGTGSPICSMTMYKYHQDCKHRNDIDNSVATNEI